MVGTVTADAAAARGLRAGTPVVLGGGDGPMGALGAGVIAVIGGVRLPRIVVMDLAVGPGGAAGPGMRTMTFAHVVPGQYVPTATMRAGGASLEWIVDVPAPGEADRYRRLLGAAESASVAAEGLFFLRHLLGERSPYWNPRARAVFAGLGRHHGPGHLARAVVEGVAFNLYTCLRAFRENGLSLDAVDAIGGAANSDLVPTGGWSPGSTPSTGGSDRAGAWRSQAIRCASSQWFSGASSRQTRATRSRAAAVNSHRPRPRSRPAYRPL